MKRQYWCLSSELSYPQLLLNDGTGEIIFEINITGKQWKALKSLGVPLYS